MFFSFEIILIRDVRYCYRWYERQQNLSLCSALTHLKMGEFLSCHTFCDLGPGSNGFIRYRYKDIHLLKKIVLNTSTCLSKLKKKVFLGGLQLAYLFFFVELNYKKSVKNWIVYERFICVSTLYKAEGIMFSINFLFCTFLQ